MKERGAVASSFFFFVFFLGFLCLLQFSALPSGQLFLAPILILFITYLILSPGPWLSVVSSYRIVACLFAVGPLCFVISSLNFSYWPWLSLWMSASFVFLPLSVLVVNACRKIRHEHFLYGFIGAVLVNSLVILFLASQGVARPAGLLSDPNLAANFCALALLSTLFLIQQSLKKSFYLIGFLLGLALFVSLSRGAVFALAGAVIIYLGMCQYKKLPWHRASLAFGLVLTLSYSVASLILADQSGLSELSVYDRPKSLSDRFDMWRSAWDMFLEAPFLGTGLGTFTLRYPAFRPFSETSSAGFFAHNDYLQLLAELGIVGFLAWFLTPVTLFVLCVRSYLRSENEVATGFYCLAISATCLIGAHSLVNFVMYHPVINVFLGCVLGASATGVMRKETAVLRCQKVPFLKARGPLVVVLALISVTFAVDMLSRKPIAEAKLQGVNFSFQSDYYYDLLALKYFSPLNIEIRNYLVTGEMNEALKLAGTPFGREITDQIIDRVNQNSWLQWSNCPQLVAKARLTWLSDEQAAIEILESILAKTPNCIQARISLSEALISREEYSEATSILNRGIDRFVFRENSGEGPVVLLETIVRAYHLSGQKENADAVEAYLQQFKRQRDLVQSPKWSRRLQF